jgi:hypothetical protein
LRCTTPNNEDRDWCSADHLVCHTTQPGILNRPPSIACENHKITLALANLGEDFRGRIALPHLPLSFKTQFHEPFSGLNGHLQSMSFIPEEVFDLAKLMLVKTLVVTKPFIHLWNDMQNDRLDIRVL